MFILIRLLIVLGLVAAIVWLATKLTHSPWFGRLVDVFLGHKPTDSELTGNIDEARADLADRVEANRLEAERLDASRRRLEAHGLADKQDHANPGKPR